MRVLIDADGCPVVDLTVRLCRETATQCLILCDTAHDIEREGAQTMVLDKGADSVDFALVNLVQPGDLVVTQDYGLASMCLARGARVLHQDGHEYTNENIDALLNFRHAAAKQRRSGARLRGTAKRTATQNVAFSTLLCTLLLENETNA